MTPVSQGRKPWSRRQWLASAALALGGGRRARAQDVASPRRPYLADMHSHYGMFLPRLFGDRKSVV